jgi:hypothetical protein
MSKKAKGKDMKTAIAVLPSTTLILSKVEIDDSNLDNAVVSEASIEQRIRLAWKHFRGREMELARARKSEARRNATKRGGGGLPLTSKRGKSNKYVAQKVGMRQTTFQNAQLVVELADQLKREERDQEAARLLDLLNNVSVNAAKKEREKLIRLIEDEEAIQQDLTRELESEPNESN